MPVHHGPVTPSYCAFQFPDPMFADTHSTMRRNPITKNLRLSSRPPQSFPFSGRSRNVARSREKERQQAPSVLRFSIRTSLSTDKSADESPRLHCWGVEGGRVKITIYVNSPVALINDPVMHHDALKCSLKCNGHQQQRKSSYS